MVLTADDGGASVDMAVLTVIWMFSSYEGFPSENETTNRTNH